ncbi:MAG: SMC-Scp complex subunit ScpB [Pseudomonadales bacterium]|nr:SMC-Scp complex subunit ScpB [Pseudomonadales bacterium]
MTLQANDLKMAVEAAIFGSDAPLSVKQLVSLFSDDETCATELRVAVADAITVLQGESASRGVELVEVASGFRYQVKSEHVLWIRRLQSRRPPRFSRALLETLAIIAYQQPVTRARIAEIRGVEASYRIMRTLMDRGWVREVGRLDAPGSPVLFSTTPAFLDYFSLRSLQELPQLAELEEIDVPDLESMGTKEQFEGAGESASLANE